MPKHRVRRFLFRSLPENMRFYDEVFILQSFLSLSDEEEVSAITEKTNGHTTGKVRFKYPSRSPSVTDITVSYSLASSLIVKESSVPVYKCVTKFWHPNLTGRRVVYFDTGLKILEVDSDLGSSIPSFLGEEITDSPNFTDELIWQWLNGNAHLFG